MTTAFIFPGQGSQSVGMLQELAQQYPVVQETFAQASAELGYDLWQLTQDGPKEELDRTVKTQPALLTAGVAAWRVLQEKGVALPSFLAGHSLGEYTALVCANALKFEDAVTLVSKRGLYMQDAVAEGEGGMAAIIGLADLDVQEICELSAEDDVLAPANFNAIGQVVIAGNAEAVDRAVILAKEKGAKMAMKIAVSVPAHSLLMQPAANRLKTVLDKMEIKIPEIPVIHNVDVQSHSDADTIKDVLILQLFSPVRWVETVQHLVTQGVDQFIECGPGKVLSGLIKRIDKSLKTQTLGDL